MYKQDFRNQDYEVGTVSHGNNLYISYSCYTFFSDMSQCKQNLD